MSHQNWYLLTGAPSTGKTTAVTRINELFTDLETVNTRMGYSNYPPMVTLKEAARALLAQGYKAFSQEFQTKVAELQVMIEMPLYHGHVWDSFVAIADRTLLDAFVYADLYNLECPVSWVELKEWMRRYDHTFVFDMKDTHYRWDGVRTDPDEQGAPSREDIQKGILSTIEQLQLPYTLVSGHLATRYQIVAQHIRRDIDKDFMGANTTEREKRTNEQIKQQQQLEAAQAAATNPLVGTAGFGQDQASQPPSPDS